MIGFARRPGLTALLRGLIAWGAIGLIWANIGAHLFREHDRAISGAINETGNLARVFEAMTIRTIDAMDQLLLITRELHAREPTAFNLSGWARATPFLNELSIQIAVADATGRVVASNLGLSAPAVSIADRAHFRVHADGSGDRLFISQPVIGRVSGRASVQFTRPMRGPDGAFRGVVVASLDPRAISASFDSAGIAQGTVLLFGLDGVPRAASPTDLLDRQTLSDPLLLDAARVRMAGSYRLGTSDEAGAIVSFRRVGSHSLAVAVSLEIADALDFYKAERRQYLLIGAGLTLLVLGLHFTDQVYRRRIARFQQALTATLDNMSQGIIMIDPDRRVPVINRRVIDLLGLPHSLAREGVDFDAVLRWQVEQGEFASADNRPDVLERVERGGLDPETPVYERVRPNGTVLEVRTTLLADGAAVRTFTDVTERRRYEQALAAARDAAEAGGRARSEFLAVMSHEIRTPLNGILGAAGLMQGAHLDEEAEHYVRIIQQAGEHLLTLVDDILDFSSLDTGRMVLAPARFDLPSLLAGVAGMLRADATAKGLSLDLTVSPDLPPSVIGDAKRLRQVLVNLVGNAIKFTRSGGVRIEADATPDPPAHTRLLMRIHDTGIGIPADKRAQLFAAFTQLDATLSRRFTGSGLGLAISHHLVALMEGSISVDSVPGEGSVFRFEVRLGVAVEPEAASPGSGSRLKVLVAEDNPTNRLVATRMLTRLGHDADAVEDGAEAVARLRQERYDVVLMDLMMPGMDGIAATRAIRADPAPLAATPIVGLTANARADDEAACLAAGMDAFLTKPVNAERLSLTLRSVLAASVSAPTVPAPTGAAPTVPAPTVPAPTVPAPSVPAPSLPAPTGAASSLSSAGEGRYPAGQRG